jgi:perosamine synthetase
MYLSAPSCRKKAMYQFVENLKSDRALFFYRGGTALDAILQAMEVGPGDEVICPVFTCPAVPYPVRRLGATPVYTDIDPRTFNIDPNRIESKLTRSTKAIIAQHTFGIPADMSQILEIARRQDVWVIEDACHALGSKYRGQEVGTLGDVSFYSFGWYKPLTLGVGGAAFVNNPELFRNVEKVYEQFATPPLRDLLLLYLQYLAYNCLVSPTSFWFLKEAYRRLSIAGVLTGTRRRKEGSDVRNPYEITPDTSRFHGKRIIPHLERRLFRKLDRWADVVAHHNQITAQYEKNLAEAGYAHYKPVSHLEPVYYKYPLLSHRKKEIFEHAKRERIEMSDMFGSPLYPPQRRANWQALGYREGLCPISEQASAQIVALPVHTKVQLEDVERTVTFLASFL